MRKDKRLAVAFTGPSNSGKTTLIIKVSIYLKKQGFKVAIVKHDPKDKAIFDQEGKDSYNFTQTGANVAVISSKRTTVFNQQPADISDVIEMLGDFDFLLVEGLKTLPLPRICIQRDTISSDYFTLSDTIATDGSIDLALLPSSMQTLDLNNIDQVVSWIKSNAKEV